jgi:hypothetical protein
MHDLFANDDETLGVRLQTCLLQKMPSILESTFHIPRKTTINVLCADKAFSNKTPTNSDKPSSNKSKFTVVNVKNR